MIPRYSIIVVSYNCLANLKACLEAARLCFAAEPGGAGCGEIVVVDNASRDGTDEWLKTQGDLLLVLNRENRGFSAACNQGAARAKGEFVLFLNPDTWAAPGCLGRMAKVFDEAKVSAVGPLSNYVAGLQRIDVQWPKAAPSLESVYASNGRETAVAIAEQLARHQSGATVETKLLIGFCLMMRRSEYMGMGGMDEDLFLGNDDLDLSWRLREKGQQLRIALDAFVLHEGQKSFKTERKEHVDNLVQQSTDALYRKLVRYYGSAEKVPSAASLWGMDWFKPSPDALKQGMAMQQQTLTSSLLSDISVLIPMLPGPLVNSAKGGTQDANGSLAEQALRETLDSLPAEVGEVLLLDANDHPAKAEGREKMRRLDIGAEMPAGMAIALAARAARKPYLLILPAGLQLTAMLNHWLSRRAPQDLGAVMALKSPTHPMTVQPFILRREIWLREAPSADSGWQAIMRDLQIRSKDMTGEADMPSLALGSAVQVTHAAEPAKVASKPQDWTPVPEDDRIRLYPETLQVPLRQAKQTLFTGTQGGSMTAGAPIRGIDLSGQSVDLSGQDLIVLRVTPDMLTDLPERLKHLRRSAHDLKRLVVVFNGNQAQGIKGDARGWHVPVDLTVPGLTSALRLAGFTVIESKPYLGFPDAAGKNLQGWHQMEAIPRSLAPVLDRKVSIIILGFNQAEYTRKCLLSIRAHTRQRYELILVDNGSSDHTWDLFRSIPGAKAIRNAENLGVAAGWNCGMREATGDYVCILNNDTLVGDGWIENMVRLCESDTAIGMVGPRSNRVAGPQVVENVAYTGEESIAPFIENWNHKHALESEDHDWVKGVCMLFPKRVVDQVGFFDERFGKGNFEDDDYSLRVRLHGFRACIAHDSFLHHFGSVSFNQAGIDWTEQMRKNKALFEAKWARGKEALGDVVVNAAKAVTATPIESAVPVAQPQSAVEPETAQPVKDDSLEALTSRIESAYAAGDIDAVRRDLVRAADQYPTHYAVLNGLGILSFHEGNGREAALCFIRSLMAKPDFADAAQNLIDVLMAMNGEVTDEEREAFAKRFPQNPVFNSGATEPAASPDWKVEVEKAIAEQRFAEALQCLGPHLRDADTRSEGFNYMGHIAFVMGQNEEALQHFQRALTEPKAAPDAVMNAIDALLILGRLPEAVEVMRRAASGQNGLNPADFQSALLQLRRAAEKAQPDLDGLQRSLHVGEESEEWLDAGNPEAARELLLKHLEIAPDDFRAHNNLGLCDYYAGRTEAAYQSFLNALKYEPACGDALINACDCAISLGRVDALPELVKRAFERDPQSPEAKRIEKLMLREGEAMRQAGSLAELEAQQEVLDAAEAKLRGGEFETAGQMFTDALQRRPANPQALNGLGIMAFTQKRFEEAYARFSEAARFNPGDQDILINLWEAARAQRRETEALGFLKHSLERNPDLPDIRAIVAAAA